MDVKERGCEGVDWIFVSQDGVHLAGLCEEGSEPSGSMKFEVFFLNSWAAVIILTEMFFSV
jgi:hypothetical protein